MKFVVNESTSTAKKVYSVNGPDTIDGFTKIPKSIGQMKGDIIVFKGEGYPVRLPIGEDGQVLVADSEEETGLKWVSL